MCSGPSHEETENTGKNVGWIVKFAGRAICSRGRLWMKVGLG